MNDAQVIEMPSPEPHPIEESRKQAIISDIHANYEALQAVLEKIDDRKQYGEMRIAAVGLVEGVELYIVYTMRGENCRIISARRANRHEREAYRQAFGSGQTEG